MFILSRYFPIVVKHIECFIVQKCFFSFVIRKKIDFKVALYEENRLFDAMSIDGSLKVHIAPQEKNEFNSEFNCFVKQTKHRLEFIKLLVSIGLTREDTKDSQIEVFEDLQHTHKFAVFLLIQYINDKFLLWLPSVLKFLLNVFYFFCTVSSLFPSASTMYFNFVSR